MSQPRSEVVFWGLNGSAWDLLLFVATVAVVVAAIATAFATFGATKVHAAESRASEVKLAQFQLSVEGRVADASKAASNAAAAAYRAGEIAGGATQRVQEQERRTAPRQVSEDLRRQISSQIQGKVPGGVVHIWIAENTSEARAFAEALSSTFHQAALPVEIGVWPYVMGSYLATKNESVGVMVYTSAGLAGGETIERALLNAGIKTSLIETHGGGESYPPSIMQPGSGIIIIVAPRPEP